MSTRALRGATTVSENNRQEMLDETAILLKEIFKRNDIDKEDVASIIFTTTGDLNAVFPAVAARELGLTEVPLMCMQEIPVPGALQKCIRILMHINSDKKNNQLNHVYLNGAVVLRPDIVKS